MVSYDITAALLFASRATMIRRCLRLEGANNYGNQTSLQWSPMAYPSCQLQVEKELELMIKNIAVRFAACAAFALAASATLPAAELAHRWSFNGDWADSAGGADAAKCGT